MDRAGCWTGSAGRCLPPAPDNAYMSGTAQHVPRLLRSGMGPAQGPGTRAGAGQSRNTKHIPGAAPYFDNTSVAQAGPPGFGLLQLHAGAKLARHRAQQQQRRQRRVSAGAMAPLFLRPPPWPRIRPSAPSRTGTLRCFSSGTKRRQPGLAFFLAQSCTTAASTSWWSGSDHLYEGGSPRKIRDGRFRSRAGYRQVSYAGHGRCEPVQLRQTVSREQRKSASARSAVLKLTRRPIATTWDSSHHPGVRRRRQRQRQVATSAICHKKTTKPKPRTDSRRRSRPPESVSSSWGKYDQDPSAQSSSPEFSGTAGRSSQPPPAQGRPRITVHRKVRTARAPVTPARSLQTGIAKAQWSPERSSRIDLVKRVEPKLTPRLGRAACSG
jgi:hypothetical protein